MMEISDLLEVGMPLRVAWSSVMVECGVQSAVTVGISEKRMWPAVNSGFQPRVHSCSS